MQLPAATEAKFEYQSGCKCLTVIAFTDCAVPPHLFQGNSTMYFFGNKTGGIVDKVRRRITSLLFFISIQANLCLFFTECTEGSFGDYKRYAGLGSRSCG